MAAQEDEGVNRSAPLAVSSTGLLMVGFLMVISGAMYLNTQLNLFDFNLDAYHIARLVICTIILTCAITTLSKGMLTTSIIMLTSAVSALTFTLEYFQSSDPSKLLDPMLSVLLYIAALIMYRTRDYIMCAATLVYAVTMTTEAFVSGQTENAILAIGLIAGGMVYTLSSAATILQYECGLMKGRLGTMFEHTGTNDIAQTPYERSVPLTSVTAGMLFLFLGVGSIDGYLYHHEMFPLIIILIIVLMMSVRMFTNGILAEGLFFLTISIVNLLNYVPAYLNLDGIPTPYASVIIIPMLAVVVLAMKTRDIMIIVASVASLANMLVISLSYMVQDIEDLEGVAPLVVISIVLISQSAIMYKKGYHFESALFVLLFALNMITFAPLFFNVPTLPIPLLITATAVIAALIVLRIGTKDTLLTIASLITTAIIIVMSIVQMVDPLFITIHIIPILWIASGIALLYHGTSRWLFICARREVVPLLSENVQISEVSLPTPEPKKDPRDHRIIDLSTLILAILLIVHSGDCINVVIHYADINTSLMALFKVILSATLLASSYSSLHRGMITETLLYMITSVSFMLIPENYTVNDDVRWYIGTIFGLFILICGLLLLHRGSVVCGTATVLFAAGMEITANFGGQTSILVYSTLILVAGLLYAVSAIYNLGWAHQENALHRRTERHRFSTRETTVTLGYLLLIVTLLTADVFDDAYSTMSIICLAAITLGVGVYVVYRNVIAEGLLILFPAMLVILQGLSLLIVKVSIPVPFFVFISIVMLCPLAVFIYRRDVVFTLTAIALIAESLVYCFCDLDVVGYVTIVPLVLLAIYTIRNWLAIEKQAPETADANT